MKKKSKQKFKPIGTPEIWEDKNKISKATTLERPGGKKGISVQMGTKVKYMTRPRYGKTIWIDEDLNLPSWLKWFVKTIKKLYYNLFGKGVIFPDENIDFYKTKIEFLTKQLAENQKKLEEMELTQQENEKLLELARKTQVKFNEFSKVYNKFRELVEKSKSENVGHEEKIKSEIKKNMWLLGLECFVEAKNQNIDKQTQIDLHIKTKYNQDRIFEIKSPNLNPFVRKKGDKKRRYTLSPQLADGLSELVVYLRRTDLYSDKRSEGTYGIQKASGYILIGYKIDDEQIRLLKEFNFHLLPHIQIFTYDNLIKNIERELSIIKTVSDQK